MTCQSLTQVDSHAHLLALAGGDPYVRWGVPDPLAGEVLALEGAVAVERTGRRHSIVVLPVDGTAGHEAAVEQLLTALRDEGHLARTGVGALSVPQQYADVLARQFALGGGGDWDWMWTVQPPVPVPGEDQLVELDDGANAEEIWQLSTSHSPRGEGDPPASRTWPGSWWPARTAARAWAWR